MAKHGKQVNRNSEEALVDRLKPPMSALPGSREPEPIPTEVARERSSLSGATETAGSLEGELSFAGFRLQVDGTLLRGETIIHLPPKELGALRLLIAHAGQIITPVELRQALWGEIHVTADSVLKCLSSLRARLEPERCIQTIYKRGYRFSAEVRVHGVAPANALPRLAIPPFATGFGIPEHLGAAVAEETIVRLSNAQPPAVTVMARDSVFMLAHQGRGAQQIGETLKADLVLAGTLRALPSHFRLRVEMIRIEDGAQIWVEDLIVPQSRVAGLESELADRLAFRLNMGARSSSAATPDSEPDSTPQNREAYEMYQRTHHEWQSLQRHRMQDSLQQLLRATELDPSLIPAKVDLAHLCVTQAFDGFMSPAVAADIVRRMTDPLQDLPLRAEAILPVLGWINFHVDRNLSAALSAFSLSAHLPHDPWITRVRSMFALSRHRFAEAIELLRTAQRQDPFAPWLHARLAWALHLAGQADESVTCVRQALDLFPKHEGALLYGSIILAYSGDVNHAIKLAHELVQSSPYFDLATAAHAYALACGGRKDEARAILQRLEWMSRERFVLHSFNPAVYVALGDLDAAIPELRISDQTRCPWFFQMLADPRLKPLRERPEFVEMQSILTRMEADAESLAPEG
jgi:DNA-binding winged helix-turn-helix (wHTH) protein